MSAAAAQVTVEGAATGQVTVDESGGRVVVEAQHGGILKLRFGASSAGAVSAQRTIVVHPWTHASLEGAMFTQEETGETVQLKERPDLLERVAFEADNRLVLSFGDAALALFARGGLLTLIDFYR